MNDLRPMSAEDLETVVALDARTRRRAWSVNQFTTELAREDRRYLVDEGPDGVRGFIGGWLAPDVGHVMTVVVAEQHRRRGVATALVRGLLGAFDVAGLSAATLEVREDNVAALALYERLGFVNEGRRPGYYGGDGSDALILWRRAATPAVTRT